MGLQRWPLKFVQHIANATCVSPSLQVRLAELFSTPSIPVQSEFHDRDAKYVLHIRAEGGPMFCMQLPMHV